MSASEISKLPGITICDEEPVFSEPWEAQVFALTVSMHENGLFTWPEWAELLGSAIAEDDGTTPYYQLWTKALETMIERKSLLSDNEIEKRTNAWKQALLNTPHGQPIELAQ